MRWHSSVVLALLFFVARACMRGHHARCAAVHCTCSLGARCSVRRGSPDGNVPLMACCCREARRMLLVVEHGHRHDLLVIVVWACRGILAVPAMQVVIVPVVREFFLVADLAADGRYLLTVTCPLTDLVVLEPG